MPFKLKLKKTRQYNVASKTLYVISVELLDGGVADCTLSIDSTGQECLDNVCQRQTITQPEFFGLRYVNQQQQARWVQLERPLKRQLEKNASSHQLYLRVMYYVVSGTTLITDEITRFHPTLVLNKKSNVEPVFNKFRYHYFLQLKSDLIEGRIVCECQQAVVLASYSLQAEYGNHDAERHTVEYLKNLLTFPKQMLDGGQVVHSSTLAETGRLEWLTAAVIQRHVALYNMSQAQAEEAFITTCQQLRGYGQEMFSACDRTTREDVTIAVSLTGIRILSETAEPQHYRWQDITNVINRKCIFTIECQQSLGSQSQSYQLFSAEAGKYVWRLCVLQHTFYMRRVPALCHTKETTFQEQLGSSRDDLDVIPVAHNPLSHNPLSHNPLSHNPLSHNPLSHNPLSHNPLAHNPLSRSTERVELREPPIPLQRVLLSQYRPAPDYETALHQKYQQQRAEAQLRYQNHQQLMAKPIIYGSHPDILRIHYPDVTRHTVNQPSEYDYGLKFVGNNYPFAVNPNVHDPQMHFVNVYKPPPPYPSKGLASNSTPDLAVASQAMNYHRGYISTHVSGSSPDLVSNRTALNRQYLGYINPNVINYNRSIPVMPPHGTYNNLASVLDPSQRILIDPHHHITDSYQKVCDERGNIMYSMPMHRLPYQRHVVMPQRVKISDTQEPIYENVPLPWQEHRGIRDRAQSLTTTDEISRLTERNSSHPTINEYGIQKSNVPNYRMPETDTDNHYVNAQVIKGVRESSLPKEIPSNLNISNRSINKPESEFENVALSIDRISIKNDEKDYDETPYQSLSTHKVSNTNNNTISNNDNITSITIRDSTDSNANPKINQNTSQNTNTTDVSALSSSIMNSTYSTVDLESSNTTNTTKSSVNSKEKKRRRWGMFMGKTKTADVKSATLGRDRAKSTTPQPTNKHRWSTGLPKFQPLPPSITKETLCQLLERKMSDDQLSFAFEQIPKGRDSGGEFKTALLPQHSAMNSYNNDDLPYEDNRVRLAPTPANPHGYINASHITMTVGSTQRFYVLIKVSKKSVDTPTSPVDPVALVWECLWQTGARLVAHVGNPTTYLPSEGAHNTGKFSVSVTQSSVTPWGIVRRVQVSCAGRVRTLWHVTGSLRMDTCDSMLGFLSELSSLRVSVECEAQSEGGVGGGNPPLAFCADGQAGVALAADLLLHILDNNQELDIPRTIGLLHQQRSGLIHSVAQYKLLHQVLLQYLKQSRLI